jgi:hypothetical protein
MRDALEGGDTLDDRATNTAGICFRHWCALQRAEIVHSGPPVSVDQACAGDLRGVDTPAVLDACDGGGLRSL